MTTIDLEETMTTIDLEEIVDSWVDSVNHDASHSSGWRRPGIWARHFRDYWEECQGEDGEEIAKLACEGAEEFVRDWAARTASTLTLPEVASEEEAEQKAQEVHDFLQWKWDLLEDDVFSPAVDRAVEAVAARKAVA